MKKNWLRMSFGLIFAGAVSPAVGLADGLEYAVSGQPMGTYSSPTIENAEQQQGASPDSSALHRIAGANKPVEWVAQDPSNSNKHAEWEAEFAKQVGVLSTMVEDLLGALTKNVGLDKRSAKSFDRERCKEKAFLIRLFTTAFHSQSKLSSSGWQTWTPLLEKNSQLNVQLQTLDQLVWKEPRNPNTPRAVPGIIDVRKAQPESTEKPESSADSAAKAAREETISQARFLLSPALDQPSFHVPGCGIAMSWKREGSSFVFTEELEDETWEFRVSGTDGSQTGKKVIKKTN